MQYNVFELKEPFDLLQSFLHSTPIELRSAPRDQVILIMPDYFRKMVEYDMQHSMFHDFISGHTLTQFRGYKIHLGYEHRLVLCFSDMLYLRQPHILDLYPTIKTKSNAHRPKKRPNR